MGARCTSKRDRSSRSCFRTSQHFIWTGLAAEAALLRAEIERRYADGRRIGWPHNWAAGMQTAELLYGIARTMKPRIVVETGVANGLMTVFFINALKCNGFGHLYSTDVDANVGVLVEPDERAWWTFHRVDPDRPRRTWRALVETLPQIDLFFHDSDHAFWWQRREYADALAHIASEGILASDDVQETYAFLDVCNARGLKPVLLLENGKVAAAAWVLVPDIRAN